MVKSGDALFPPIMSIRPATHSGSWYSARLSTLEAQITKHLAAGIVPKRGTRVLLGPHAGYTYCGQILGETYASWDTSKVETVIILSPSHYVYFKGARVLKYSYYATPYGKLKVDQQVAEKLVESGSNVKYMNSETDNEEHGVEMHIPFLHRVTKDLPQGAPSIVPILICDTTEAFEKQLGEALAPYLEDERFSVVISSDFCHWGERFDYTIYTSQEDTGQLVDLQTRTALLDTPIYKLIEYLDRKAMEVASTGSYDLWRKYIKRTGNTICGQKPVAIVLAALEALARGSEHKPYEFQWNGYAQSNKVQDVFDSSVSYASGYVVLE